MAGFRVGDSWLQVVDRTPPPEGPRTGQKAAHPAVPRHRLPGYLIPPR